MKKVLVFAAVFIGLAVLAKSFAPKVQDIDWEERFERMPDNAPPKWMFNNIRTIRENTDQILELVARERSDAPAPGGADTDD
jgi:hypothetical protein